MSGYAAAYKHGLAILHGAILAVQILSSDLVESTLSWSISIVGRIPNPRPLRCQTPLGANPRLWRCRLDASAQNMIATLLQRNPFTLSCVVPMNPSSERLRADQWTLQGTTQHHLTTSFNIFKFKNSGTSQGRIGHVTELFPGNFGNPQLSKVQEHLLFWWRLFLLLGSSHKPIHLLRKLCLGSRSAWSLLGSVSQAMLSNKRHGALYTCDAQAQKLRRDE